MFEFSEPSRQRDRWQPEFAKSESPASETMQGIPQAPLRIRLSTMFIPHHRHRAKRLFTLE
jgi:hypothetical protein